jgi:hypothetical protein
MPRGKVSGTLPPGYTKNNPPVDLAAPETAQKIREATDASDLKVRSIATAAKAKKAKAKAKAKAAVTSTSGCVSAISSVNASGLSYKGQMAGCSFGTLWMHTYLNANGVRVQDGNYNTCYSSTSCSVPNDLYSGNPACRTFVNYAHGINRSTGGDSTAYTVWAPWRC